MNASDGRATAALICQIDSNKSITTSYNWQLIISTADRWVPASQPRHSRTTWMWVMYAAANQPIVLIYAPIDQVGLLGSAQCKMLHQIN